MRLALFVLCCAPALIGCVTAPPAPVAPIGVQRLDTGPPAPDTGLSEVTPR